MYQRRKYDELERQSENFCLGARIPVLSQIIDATNEVVNTKSDASDLCKHKRSRLQSEPLTQQDQLRQPQALPDTWGLSRVCWRNNDEYKQGFAPHIISMNQRHLKRGGLVFRWILTMSIKRLYGKKLGFALTGYCGALPHVN